MKTLVILILAAVMTTAHAQRSLEETTGAGEGRDLNPNLTKMLELDDATSAKIEQLRNDHQKNVIALRAKMKTARVDFRSMMKKDTPNESALLSKQKEISGIRADLEAANLQHRFAVGKLLTPEQRKLLATHGERRMKGARGITHDRGGNRVERAHHRGDVRKHRQGSRGIDSCCR